MKRKYVKGKLDLKLDAAKSEQIKFEAYYL